MSITQFLSFPTRCLPAPLAAYTQEVAQIKCCDESVIALALIVACGSSIGACTKLQIRPSWLEGAQIWGGNVQPSGRGKTHQIGDVIRPIQTRQTELLDDFEAEFDAWRTSGGVGPAPAPERLWTNNTTIELLLRNLADNPHGLLFYSDELKGIFGGLNAYKGGKGNDCETLLSAWSGEPILYERLGAKHKDHSGIFNIKNSFLCVFGGIQPAVLSKLMNDVYMENGAIPRFLYTMPPVQKRVWIPEDDDSTQKRLPDIYQTLRKTRSRDGELKIKHFTDEAQELWIDFYLKKGEGIESRHGYEAAITEKYVAYAARMSLIFHLTRLHCSTEPGVALRVDTTSLSNAIEISNWFLSEATRIQIELDYRIEERLVVEYMRKSPRDSVAPWEIAKNYGHFKSADQAEKACRSLEKKGLLVGIFKDTEPREGGRPACRFRLMPGSAGWVLPRKPQEAPSKSEVIAVGGAK